MQVPVLITMLRDREQAPINSLIQMDQGPGVPNSAEENFADASPSPLLLRKGRFTYRAE